MVRVWSVLLRCNAKVAGVAPNDCFTLQRVFYILGVEKGVDNNLIFGERLKEEREKRSWSQNDLAERLHVSRQTVSKWETGKNYPNIEILIGLSDLFGITVDELLRSDKELEEKVIRDGKQLAHPNWKSFFDCIFLLGVFTMLFKLAVLALNKWAGMEFELTGDWRVIMNVVPLAFLIIGGIGSDQLKKKFKE